MPRKRKAILTQAQARAAWMKHGLERNYQYDVEVDYESYRDCDAAGCDSICRCARLENVHVDQDSINLEYITDHFMTKKEAKAQDNILKYCIERLLVINKMYDPDCWYVHVGGGYYGQEIYGVTLDINDRDQIPFYELVDKSNVERVKYVLEKEYGYLLEELKPKNKARVVHPKVEDVKPVMNSYPKMIDGSMYGERWLPYCVCTKEDGVYRIIDGHHRYASALSRGLTKIPVVLLY